MSADAIDMVLRLTAVLLPLAGLACAVMLQPTTQRQRMAALLAGLTSLAGIVVLNHVAARVGWWAFTGPSATVAGQPPDLVIAWAVLWGPLPVLVDRWRLRNVLTALVMLDVVVMPLLADVTLSSTWLVGEAVGLALVAAPAIQLGRWVAQRRHIARRSWLQVWSATLWLVGLPLVVVATMDPSNHGPAPRAWQRWLGLQVIALGVIPAVSAVIEFRVRGRGTPWPWDPPARLVDTGPYRFVANPMQLGGCVVLIGLGITVASWWPVALAVSGAAFSVTAAALHEDTTIATRLGEAWQAFATTHRSWLPTRRPAPAAEESSQPAVLWVAATCTTCHPIGRWIRDQDPVQLVTRPAEAHPDGMPARVTYEAPDGHHATGVVAFARALEHLQLEWALAGLLLRLPGVVQAAAVIADTVGFGPLRQPATLPAGADEGGTTQLPPDTPPLRSSPTEVDA